MRVRGLLIRLSKVEISYQLNFYEDYSRPLRRALTASKALSQPLQHPYDLPLFYNGLTITHQHFCTCIVPYRRCVEILNERCLHFFLLSVNPIEPSFIWAIG
jgi:hypothetical protein